MDLIITVFEAIASLIFKEAAEVGIKEILIRKVKRKTTQIRSNQKKLLSETKDIILKGELG